MNQPSGFPNDRSYGWFPLEDGSDHPKDRPDRPARRPDGPQYINSAFLTIVHCRGVVLGDNNTQINTIVYRIDQPTVDMSTVLDRPEVRDALAALGQADPDSFDAAREHAEKVLSAGSWYPLGQSLIDLRLSSPQARSNLGTMMSLLQGAVLIEDCRGVLIGSHDSQYNEFQYVCPSAPIGAVELLAGNKALAHALVEHVVVGGGTGAIDRALSDTLERSALAQKSVMPNTSISTGYQYGRIANHDGVAVGSGNKVRTTVKVRPIVDETRDGIVRNLTTLQSDINGARRQIARWQDGERKRAIQDEQLAANLQQAEAAARKAHGQDAAHRAANDSAAIIRRLIERQEEERRAERADDFRERDAAHRAVNDSAAIIRRLIERQEEERRAERTNEFRERDGRDDRGRDSRGGGMSRF